MKIHRTFLLTLLLTMFAGSLMAQVGVDMPKWVFNKPTATPAHNYYYRVTMGEGPTLDKAYAKAFAKAILEANMKMGVRVTASTSEEQIESEITKQINMEDYTMEIKINKACEFWEEIYSPKRYRMYVLWQVGESALTNPTFDEYNCQ